MKINYLFCVLHEKKIKNQMDLHKAAPNAIRVLLIVKIYDESKTGLSVTARVLKTRNWSESLRNT